ncbi:PH domain-containing protein [Naumannella halotolerans]|uniref:YdbS-like PH domain-containing protein n=1 Tax=Naumannella halotolerans TaxID=993414 RepID=A0A4R7J4T7_9ACTN|nr:PH domain-containing protein [Naumannella halotolerans]TDT31337.1 hypothetical protein CLV29_2755 [Naumannella halotolerans]
MTPDQLFAPPSVAWQRLSPRWATVRRIGAVISYTLLFAVPAVVLGLIFEPWVVAIPVVAWIAFLSWRLIRIGTLCASWGYAELDEDLYITRGLWFRRLTAVPYGRMQVVEVESGPIERAFGLARVKLVTASASTDAMIPGLPPERAAELRDRLTQRAETGSSGL